MFREMLIRQMFKANREAHKQFLRTREIIQKANAVQMYGLAFSYNGKRTVYYSTDMAELRDTGFDMYEDGCEDVCLYEAYFVAGTYQLGKCILNIKQYQESDERYYDLSGEPWDV